MTELCKLCCRNPLGPKSHIIPSFVIKWLKETSATGRIRQGINPNIRMQDGLKPPMFCTDCEGIISKLEKTFSEKIFTPYLSGGKMDFEYEEWLSRYLVSQSLRCSLFWLEDFSKDRPDLSAKVLAAINHWKSCLLSDQVDRTHQHHLIFSNFTEATEHFSEFVYWYLERTTDTVLLDGKNEVLAFTVYPKMIIISFVYPTGSDSGFVNTQVFEKGQIAARNQEISYPGIANTIKESAQFVEQSIKSVSERQQRKVDSDTQANPNWFDSDT